MDPSEFEREKFLAKVHRSEMFSRRIFVTVWIGLGLVALWIIRLIVESLAGRATVVDVSVSIAAALTVTGSYFLKRRQLQSQHDDLVRLRARCEALEEEVEYWRGGGADG